MDKYTKGFVILAESGSDLPKDIAEKYDIEIVPMHVMFNHKNYDDGEFPIKEIIDYYDKTKTIPTTSATNVGEYMNAYQKIHQEHPDKLILHLCYSAVTTATYQNANIASEGLDYVCHIDTQFVSGGQGFLLYKVAKYLENYPDIELKALKSYIYKLIEKTHMVFLPSQLDFLKAGGRVSNAAYLGANILGLKPIIEIIDGKLVGTKKYRGRDMKKICKRMMNEFLTEYDCHLEDFFMLHFYGLDKTIMKETENIAKEHGFQNIRWIETGGVITSHSGPGCFGFIFEENK